MRASRLLSILILLQLRGRVTAEALAEEFEVSTRSIYRDIDELSAAGIPVIADRGPGGGFQLLDGYRTDLTGLATDELEAMFMIGMPGPAAALGLGSAAAKVGKKLLATLPKSSSEGAARMGMRFHLDPVDWYRDAEPVENLPQIARAVLDQHYVAMRYQSWTSIREWMIEPLGLVLKAGAWYLVASSDHKIRTFKTSNILEHRVQASSFKRPNNFDLANYWSASLKRFESGLRPIKVILRASEIGLKRLSALGAYAAQAINTAEKLEHDDWASLIFPVENTEQAALLFLGIGPEIEVIEPKQIRERLKQLALQVVTHANTESGSSKKKKR
jgi:predicted DNA-binding transcriptional regulator YafY